LSRLVAEETSASNLNNDNLLQIHSRQETGWRDREFYEGGCQETFLSPRLGRDLFSWRPAPSQIGTASRCGLLFSPHWMSSFRRHQQLHHRPTLKLTRAAGWLSWQPDGSIGGSWPTAFFGYPRGHTVITEAWCRSTLAKLAIRYSPSTVEPQTSERMLPDQQRSERIQALKLLVLSVSSDRSSLPSSKGLKQSPRVCAPR
jgi:hypothetical protein